MRKPPITITCDCGEQSLVAYGDRWQCESCGRSWNTQQIPAEDYERLLRRMRSLRFEALGVALVIAACVIPIIVFVSTSFIFVVPVVAAAWLFIYVPKWRRKARTVARTAPQWELHPE